MVIFKKSLQKSLHAEDYPVLEVLVENGGKGLVQFVEAERRPVEVLAVSIRQSAVCIFSLRYNFASLIQVTHAQIEEIQAESREKGISIKQVLQEKDIPAHQYFWWKRKYSRPDIPDGFLPIAGGGLPAGMSVSMGVATPHGKQKVEPVEDDHRTAHWQQNNHL